MVELAVKVTAGNPETEAVIVYVPGKEPSTTMVLTSPRLSDTLEAGRSAAPDAPLGTEEKANVTVTPGTALSKLSPSRTTRGWGRAKPADPVWPLPDDAIIAAGAPGKALAVKRAASPATVSEDAVTA